MTEARPRATEDALDPPREGNDLAAHIRVVRAGHGANCSSIGSVIDTLFVTALAGGAIFAAIVAALGQESIRVVGDPPRAEGETKPEAESAPEDTP